MDFQQLVTGTIIEASLTGNSYKVVSDEDGSTLPGCISAVGGFFAPLLGIRINYKHHIGANVLVMRGAPAMILCELPNALGVPSSTNASSVTTADTVASDLDAEGETDSAVNPQLREKRDLLSGELDMANVMQVGVTWLTHMLKLHAGDRVKLELHLVNDLLRLVAENLHLVTGAGDWTCFNDGGQITQRHDWTSYEHEAWGLKSARDPKVTKIDGGLPDYADVPETGRWRCSEFSGALGDMIHKFVTDPADSLGQLAQERAGKHREWVGADGSHIIQSVGDISLERVCRIVVPVELKRPDDPTGDTIEESLLPRADFLDVWRPDPREPWTMAYHLRDYSRWLSNYAGYARFLQRKKDWLVKAETETPVPQTTAWQKDREKAVPASLRVPVDTYACIRIMRDGSIVTLNGYGCSSTMIGPDIILSATRDLRMEAGRNVVITAGDSFFVKARRNVEIVAVLGSWVASARARMAMWCEQGTVLIRTLMKTDERGTPAAHRFNNPDVGVVIDAPNSNAILSSRRTVVEATSAESKPGEQALRLQTPGDVAIKAGAEKSVLFAGGKLSTNMRDILLRARDAIQWAAPDIDFGGLLRKTRGRLLAQQLSAVSLLGKTIIHGQRLPGGTDKHINHVLYSGAAADISMPDPLQLAGSDTPVPAAEGALEVKRARPVCDYLRPDAYQASNTHQSLTQQHMQLNLSAAESAPEKWNFADDAEAGDPDASFKKPYPGARAVVTTYPSENNLHKPSSKAPEEFTPAPSKNPEPVPAMFYHPPT